MPTGIYISVPFCRTKCSYCNFASGVFARSTMGRYVERICEDLAAAGSTAARAGGMLDRDVDSVYLGGGTPTTLQPADVAQLFAVLGREFQIQPAAEITVECAPGTLSPQMLDTLGGCGVNRVSLGVQSFLDSEAAAVGRQHDRATVLADIARLRRAGIANFNLDLIAGLPHQNTVSWRDSLNHAIAAGAPHISVYMLEVDEDSRLGRELIAGGTRYHAHFVPDDDLTADLYLEACSRLERAGIAQYEISNFSVPGMESRHNLKYWTRQPYLGVGLDAHSMLWADPYALVGTGVAEEKESSVCMVDAVDADAVRLASVDVLQSYLDGAPPAVSIVSRRAAREETMFLGLRLNRGVNLKDVAARFGRLGAALTVAGRLERDGLLERDGDTLRLTSRGRLLSNEVFSSFLDLEVGTGGAV